MQLLKFSLFLFSYFYFPSVLSFDPTSCLKASFSSEVVHDGWPMGLSKNTLIIKKEKCNIYVEHKRLKYLEQRWHVDVCREPVHIKKGRTVEVLKKTKSCNNKSKEGFCQELDNLEAVIQDDHGKVYCMYQLLRAYTRQDKILDVNKPFFFDNVKRKIQEREKESDAPRPIIEGEATSLENEAEEEPTQVEQSPSAARTF
jgi:hypothetical protein